GHLCLCARCAAQHLSHRTQAIRVADRNDEVATLQIAPEPLRRRWIGVENPAPGIEDEDTLPQSAEDGQGLLMQQWSKALAVRGLHFFIRTKEFSDCRPA